MATKKVAKKVAPPQPAKVAKPVKKVIPATTATLVSFSVTAVIPTQQYGNIQPKIEVTASSIEEARACVMPVIEDLFKTYGEGKPSFLGRVTETVKTVVPVQQDVPGGVNTPSMPPAPITTNTTAAQASNATASPSTDVPAKQKTEAVLKAEKAISLASSADAALLIQDQIEKSVKIAPEDKPDLITLVLKKRNEFK